MSKLTTKQRNHFGSSVFGLPGQRKYPMPDKPHARLAKAMASKEVNAGRLSSEEKERIDRKADRVLNGR